MKDGKIPNPNTINPIGVKIDFGHESVEML